MKKDLKIFIPIVLLSFFFLPVAHSAPQIDGVMSYTDNNDWGSLSKTTTSDFKYWSTTLSNVVVEEGDAYGVDNYDVEELGVYIEDNTLYIGLQTQYDLSSDPDGQNIYAGDFIFSFGGDTDNTLSDYDYNNDNSNNGEYDYAFAFDFTVDDQGAVDITFLSGNMTGTGVGDVNNYGTDWGIESASTQVDGSEISYTYGYSNTNADSTDNYYLDGQYTLELAINLDSLSDELSTLLSNSGEHESIAMYWQPSCGNDFLAAKADFNYTPGTVSGGESPVPEPNTMLLFGMGLLGAGALGRWRERLGKS